MLVQGLDRDEGPACSGELPIGQELTVMESGPR